MIFLLKKFFGQAQWAYICNPSFLSESRDWEDHGSRPKVVKIPSQPIKAGHSGVCLSSQLQGSINRIMVQDSPGINKSPHQENI
jgi:hypothetical protein